MQHKVIQIANLYLVNKSITLSQDIREKGFELLREIAKLLNENVLEYNELIEITKILEIPLNKIDSGKKRFKEIEEMEIEDDREIINDDVEEIKIDSQIIKDEYIGEKKLLKILGDEWI